MVRTGGLSLLLFATPGLCLAQEHGVLERGGDADSAPAAAPQTGGVPSSSFRIDAFPRALVSNTAGLISRDNIIPFLVGAGLSLTARSFDDEVQDAIADKATGVGDVGDAIGDRFVVTGAIVGLFVLGQVTPDSRFRQVMFDLAQGLIINGVITTALKRSFGRQRPDSTSFSSFPSGHTSSLFSLTTILARHFGPKVGIPALATATFVAVSRVEDNEHFLSDIVAGGTVGFIVGRTVTAHLAHGSVGSERRVSVSPFPVRRGGGVYVSLTF